MTGTGIVHLDSFRLPSGNIGCRTMTDSRGPMIACAIAESTATLCDAGWNHAFQLGASGNKTCEPGPVVAVPTGPVLLYGEANVVNGIVCRSGEQSGLTCWVPMYGSYFTVTASAMVVNNGEGGFQLADLGSAQGSNPATVTVPADSGPHVFASADLGVVCKAENSAFASVLCQRVATPTSGACTDATRTAYMVGISQGLTAGSYCGGPTILQSPGTSSLQPLAKVKPGTRILVGPITCTVNVTWVSCIGGGDGFSMSASGYRPLPGN